jgi:hypothetical protein
VSLRWCRHGVIGRFHNVVDAGPQPFVAATFPTLVS